MKTQSIILTLMFVLGISLSTVANLNELNDVNLEEFTVLVDELEESLEIEDWMVEDEIWEPAKHDFILVEEEESIEIEDWMIENDIWEPAEHEFTLVEEVEISEIESWMTDEDFWK